MGISVSYQVSNSILSKANLKVADKHNERKYKLKSSEYSNSDINPEYTKFNKRLFGTKEIYKDVEKLYNTEFLEAIQDYNSKQKRNDRKIYDYFEKISESKTSLYTEVIVQIGDQKYWKNKDIEEKKKMIAVFEKQLELSNEFFPNFKVVNAIVHLDETSPHMHIIGVPVSNKNIALQVNEKKKKQKKLNGLDTYVCQSEIFTSSNLKEFHQIFSEKSLQLFNEIYQINEVLNDKKLHQQHLDLATYKRVAPIINARQKEYDKLKEDIEDLEKNKVKIKDLIEKERKKYITISDIKKNVVEKKGLLNREIKITLDQEDYNTLLAYAIEGEEKNKELEKYIRMYSDLKEAVTNYTINVKADQEQEQNEKKKLITEKDEILKKLERILSKNNSLNSKLENEKVKNKNFIKNKIELEEKIKNLENENNNLFESIEDLISYVEKSNKEMSNFLNEKFKKDWREKTLYNDILESENIIDNIVLGETFFEESTQVINNKVEIFKEDNENNNDDLLAAEREKEEQLYLERMILLSKIEIYENEIINMMNEEEKANNFEKINNLKMKKNRVSDYLIEDIDGDLAFKFIKKLAEERKDLISKNQNYSELRKQLDTNDSSQAKASKDLTKLIISNNKRIKVINYSLFTLNSKFKTNNSNDISIKNSNFKFLKNNLGKTNNSLKLRVMGSGRIIINDDIEDNDDNIISNSPRAKRSRSTRSRSRGV